MPPRLIPLRFFQSPNGPQPIISPRVFSSAPSSQTSTIAQRRRRRDPYAIAQARARKTANLSRQDALRKERTAALGDPVRGKTTPFVKSFDAALPSPTSPSSASVHDRDESFSRDDADTLQSNSDHLNFFLSKSEFSQGLEHSRWLSTPPESHIASAASDSGRGKEQASNDVSSKWLDDLVGNPLRDRDVPLTAEQWQKRLQEDGDTASEALRRIASLSLGSSKDRFRVNVQRCINVFGRHNTDKVLAPKVSEKSDGDRLEKTPRVGPDTGSSEVQIAILTAKIRTLADFLELRGGHDKANKRNLRLLVHRRAKLLKYFRRKERAGPRWVNLVETLGLTEGTWKEQISI